MASICHKKETCRLCGAKDLASVLTLAPSPPANAFVGADALDRDQPVYPLEVNFCGACGHVQLGHVVDAAELFRDYVYVSGTSPVFVAHFDAYAETLVSRFEPGAGALAVDIGSNDGTLLGKFQDRGLRVLGVDPARAIARRATEAGIETVAEFFSPELAAGILKAHGPASLVTANNMFAHVDDLAGVVEGVKTLLDPAGVFVFEVSYLVDVFEKTLFDTIYHEHLSYHSVKPLVAFFAGAGMELIAARRMDVHGGSLRGTVQLSGGPHAADGSVEKLIAQEETLGLDKAATLRAFARRIDALKAELTALLDDLAAGGKRIAGYGAPAKATTLMYHFAIGPERIDFIVDDSPLKQGLFSPGLHIPVVGPDALAAEHPDYLLILAWNFADPIMEKMRAFKGRGGRFILPLPEVKVV